MGIYRYHNRGLSAVVWCQQTPSFLTQLESGAHYPQYPQYPHGLIAFYWFTSTTSTKTGWGVKRLFPIENDTRQKAHVNM